MKKRLICLLAVMLLMTAVFPAGVSAQADEQLKQDCAAVLSKLKIMQGDNSGNLMLHREVTRAEFVTLVTRMMGWDRDTALDNVKLDFADSSDIHNWATHYIKVALKHNLIVGYNTVNGMVLKPNNPVTTAEAAMILIRALGYESAIRGSWPDGVMELAASIRLLNNMNYPSNHKLTRGETAVMLYNCLTVKFAR